MLDKPGPGGDTAGMQAASDFPSGPTAAAVHADPYPYYARLREKTPFFFDEDLGSWVASTAGVIDEVLAHAGLRVRPPAEPVPPPLAGTPAGEVFALLVRMNDGDFHPVHRPQMDASAARLSMGDVAKAAAGAARDLAPRTGPNDLLSRLPVQAMARLLGVASDALDATTAWVEDFVHGIAANASTDAISRASLAALQLMAQGEALGLDKVRSANRIAMMQQSLDATAGLIGNTVRRLQSRPGGPDAAASLNTWRSVVAEVARWDSPVQNTRRYAAAGLRIAGQDVSAGQGILVLLACGNRDAALNDNPDEFDAARSTRRMFSFGAGRHHCPGEAIAMEIASSALKTLHAGGDAQRLFKRVNGFRPLPNARIPIFET